MRRADYLLLLALSLAWGCAFLFFKLLAGELPPMTVAFGRVAIAAAVIASVLAARGVRPGRYVRHWRGLLLLGLLNNAVPFTLLAWGLARTESGTASIVNATTPLMVALVALACGGRLAWNAAAGIGLGFLGVVVLVGPSALRGGSSAGNLACLGAALSYGLSARVMAGLRDLPPLVLAAGQLLSSSLILLPLVLLVDRPWTLPPPSAAGWLALLALGLISTALAYALFFRLVASAGAANAMLVTLLVPVTALILGNRVLGEPITRDAVLGAAIIAAGLVLLDGRWRRPARGDTA